MSSTLQLGLLHRSAPASFKASYSASRIAAVLPRQCGGKRRAIAAPRPAVERKRGSSETSKELEKLVVPSTPPSKGSPAQEQEQQQQGQEAAAAQQQPAASTSGSEMSVDDIMLSIDELRQRGGPRQEAKKESLVQGVLEEVRLIRWPTLGQALVQTLLVVALVGGTSLLLFAVNTGLNELSQVVYKH